MFRHRTAIVDPLRRSIRFMNCHFSLGFICLSLTIIELRTGYDECAAEDMNVENNVATMIKNMMNVATTTKTSFKIIFSKESESTLTI